MGVKEDLDRMVKDPSLSIVSSYHDAGSCWQLIDAAIIELRRRRSDNAALETLAKHAAETIETLRGHLSVNIDKNN